MRLLLDAGGVLVDQRTIPSILETLPVPFDLAWQFWRKAVRERLWRGRISIEEAIGDFTEWSAVVEAIADKGVLKPLPSNLTPSLLPWAEEAVSLGCRTAILSNHRHEWLLPALAPLRDRLDAVFVSSLIGECKPAGAAFLKVCQLWHCEPREVVFVDDQAENLDTAVQLGMRVVRANPENRTWIDTVRHIGGKL